MNKHITGGIFLGILVSLVTSALATSASPGAMRDFRGEWAWKDVNPNNPPYATLSLDIAQEGAKISGVYCYVARSGSRIDCPDGDGDNVSGSAMGGVAFLIIRSSYFGKNFKARVELAADSLRFNVIEPVQDERFFAPKDVLLKRREITE